MTDLSKIIANWNERGTAGPWRLRPSSDMGDRCTVYYDEVWSDGTDILVASEATRAHTDGGRANMLLIAAAPDMAARIEALEEGLRAVVELADAGLIDEACDHARAALNGKDEQ